MFDDKSQWDDSEFDHIAEVVIHFLEDETGTWHSRVEPLNEQKCRGDLRTVYKLALCMAVVQDTLKKRMGAMDAILRTNEEIQKIQAELTDDRPDTEKYQTKLPFKEKTG
jgi:hypothetical protein